MDIKTGLSVYNKQWLIEPSAALQMLDFWERVKAGEMNWDYRKARATTDKALSTYKIYQQFFEKDSVIMAPDSSYDMEDFTGFNGATIAVIPVTGPLMKNDFCGCFGTNTLRQLTQMASGTDSVKMILFVHDSPGGTVDGTQAFADTIAASPKRTVSLIEGMMCSADYWIGSACDEVYASSKTDIIGSIGTMCAFYDTSKAMESRGVVLREYYATESKDKNKAGRDAMAGDGKQLIQETLDPINDVFLSSVRENRDGKIATAKENVLTGKTYTAENALNAGLIDGIKTFEDIIKEGATPATNSTFKTYNKMTASEFQAAHPAAYNEIYSAGVNAEKIRVNTWMAYMPIDAEVVTKGITEGKTVDPVVMAEMQVKAISKQKITAIEGDNPPTVKTAEEQAAVTAQEKTLEKFNAEKKGLFKQFTR